MKVDNATTVPKEVNRQTILNLVHTSEWSMSSVIDHSQQSTSTTYDQEETIIMPHLAVSSYAGA